MKSPKTKSARTTFGELNEVKRSVIKQQLLKLNVATAECAKETIAETNLLKLNSKD